MVVAVTLSFGSVVKVEEESKSEEVPLRAFEVVADGVKMGKEKEEAEMSSEEEEEVKFNAESSVEVVVEFLL